MKPLENELLQNFRDMWDDELRKLAIKLVMEISHFNPRQLVLNLAEDIADEMKEEEELRKFHQG